jgi:hypothetical protein
MLLCTPPAIAELIIGDYEVVNQKRLSLTEFQYTATAHVTNTGDDALENVTATLSSPFNGVTVVDGALTFGDVPAGSTVKSVDTVTINYDRAKGPLNVPTDLIWLTVSDGTIPEIESPFEGSGTLEGVAPTVSQPVYQNGDTIKVTIPTAPAGQSQYFGLGLPSNLELVLDDLNNFQVFNGQTLPEWRGGETVIDMPVTADTPRGAYDTYLLRAMKDVDPLNADANQTALGVNSFLVTNEIKFAPVTDPETELGIIVTTGDETMGIFGTKDSDGRLTSINSIVLGSQTDTSQNITLTLGSDYLPETLEFPDGSKVEISDYTDTGATMRRIHPDGSMEPPIQVPLPMDDIRRGQEAAEEYVRSPQPTQGNPIPSTAGSTSSPIDSNCLKVMTLFHGMAKTYVRIVSLGLQGVTCVAAGSAIFATGGLAILAAAGTAAWACGSLFLDVTASSNSVLGQAKQANKVAKVVISCVPSQLLKAPEKCVNRLAKNVLSGLVESFNPENFCRGSKASSNGDPHLYTFDNLAYDFQAVGEFILAKSTVDTFEVQVRQKPWGNRTSVAIIQAAAMNVAGDKVGFYLGQNPLVYINGNPQELIEGTNPLRMEGSIVKDGSLYTVRWPDGNGLVEIRGHGDHYNVSVYISDSQKGHLIGLLGNADDDPQNDIATRDGVSLGTELEFDDLYPGYADSWRISQEESLFDYAPGETTETFTDRNFPRLLARASDLSAEDRAAAEQICREAGITDPVLLENCILDVALTGNEEFAQLPPDLAEPETTADVSEPDPPTIGDPGFGQFKGFVYDAVTEQPLNGALVKLTVDGTPLPGTAVYATANGLYETDVVPTGAGYHLSIESSGYISEQVFNQNAPDREVFEIEPIKLVPVEFDGVGYIAGTVHVEEQPDNIIPNLTVNVRRYINNRNGDILETTLTDQNGYFRVDNLSAGNYTLELHKTGRVTNYVTATVVVRPTTRGQTTNVDAVISPELGDAQFRIVLSRGESPYDLDSHLTGPNGQGGRFHVYYDNWGSNNSEPYALLDRDDTSSFGPETITITRLQQGDVYRYSVHDFSNGGSTSSHVLANSGAKVEVYNGSALVASYNVPNQEGTLWTVFEIDEYGVIKPVNTMGYEVNQGGIRSRDGIRSRGTSSVLQKPVATDYWPIVFQATKP